MSEEKSNLKEEPAVVIKSDVAQKNVSISNEKPSDKRKRGLKPRSKRNRKRAKGGVGIYFENDGKDEDEDTTKVETEIVLLNQFLNEIDIPNVASSKRIRVIKPYPFTFATFAKARWIGRSILDVYNEEFGSYPKSYYSSAVKAGRILVSGNLVDINYKIKGHDELSHCVHRHEPAVAIRDGEGDQMITVLHQDENVIVVDKPSTLPVHPCGGYNFNSLFHILTEQDPSLEGKLHNVHRLDRLTSGLTIIAKSTEVAKTLTKCISDRDNCHKVYIARVKGMFPKGAPLEKQFKNEGKDIKHPPVTFGERIDKEKVGEDAVSASEPTSLFWISDGEGCIQNTVTMDDVFESRVDTSSILEDGSSDTKDTLWLHLSCPCEIVCHKNGICKAGSGKAAQTSFSVLGYDSKTDSTLVLAKPVTGRTHQIRLHLQYLGHPIANDPNYGGEMNFGDEAGLALFTAAQTRIRDLDTAAGSCNLVPDNAISTDVPATDAEISKAGGHEERKQDESLLSYIKRSCVWCARSKGENRNALEFLVRSRGIWLHAFQYSVVPLSKKMTFRTPLPDWATNIK